MLTILPDVKEMPCLWLTRLQVRRIFLPSGRMTVRTGYVSYVFGAAKNAEDAMTHSRVTVPFGGAVKA